jgi:hypothetical protein
MRKLRIASRSGSARSVGITVLLRASGDDAHVAGTAKDTVADDERRASCSPREFHWFLRALGFAASASSAGRGTIF